MEKKKAALNEGVVRPKGNGIKDGKRKGYCVYAVSFWEILIISKVRPITLLSLLFILLKTVKKIIALVVDLCFVQNIESKIFPYVNIKTIVLKKLYAFQEFIIRIN